MLRSSVQWSYSLHSGKLLLASRSHPGYSALTQILHCFWSRVPLTPKPPAWSWRRCKLADMFTASGESLRVLHQSQLQVSTRVKILTPHMPSLLGSQSTRQMCYRKKPSRVLPAGQKLAPSLWFTWAGMDHHLGRCTQKVQLWFQQRGKKWKGCLAIHFVVCRLIALMALSLKVLAVKHCFLSLLEFSALIISSSFWKLFIESIALVSLHARRDRKKALYRCMHRADLFNILLRTTRYPLQTRKTQKTPSSSQNYHAVLAAEWVMLAGPKCGKVNLLPRLSGACLACEESSPTSPHSANLQKASFSSAVNLASFFKCVYARSN